MVVGGLVANIAAILWLTQLFGFKNAHQWVFARFPD